MDRRPRCPPPQVTSKAPCGNCTRIRNYGQSAPDKDQKANDYFKMMSARIDSLVSQTKKLQDQDKQKEDTIVRLRKIIRDKNTEIEKLRKQVPLVPRPMSKGGKMSGGKNLDPCAASDPNANSSSEIKLKTALLQLEILMKRNAILEKRQQSAALQGHAQIMNDINMSVDGAEGGRNMLCGPLNVDLVQYSRYDPKMTLEDRLMMLEIQVANCCRERAEILSCLESSHDTVGATRSSGTRDVETPMSSLFVPPPAPPGTPLSERLSSRGRSSTSSRTPWPESNRMSNDERESINDGVEEIIAEAKRRTEDVRSTLNEEISRLRLKSTQLQNELYSTKRQLKSQKQQYEAVMSEVRRAQSTLDNSRTNDLINAALQRADSHVSVGGGRVDASPFASGRELGIRTSSSSVTGGPTFGPSFSSRSEISDDLPPPLVPAFPRKQEDKIRFVENEYAGENEDFDENEDATENEDFEENEEEEEEDLEVEVILGAGTGPRGRADTEGESSGRTYTK